MHLSQRLARIVVVGLAVGLAPSTVSACPNCKEAVAAQPAEVANVARGFNLSVLFMVSVPFVLLGTGSLVVVRAARKGLLPEL